METSRERFPEAHHGSRTRRLALLLLASRVRRLTAALPDTFRRRLRTLFWICGTNFLFPGMPLRQLMT
jgi:hypothetical protein